MKRNWRRSYAYDTGRSILYRLQHSQMSMICFRFFHRIISQHFHSRSTIAQCPSTFSTHMFSYVLLGLFGSRHSYHGLFTTSSGVHLPSMSPPHISSQLQGTHTPPWLHAHTPTGLVSDPPWQYIVPRHPVDVELTVGSGKKHLSFAWPSWQTLFLHFPVNDDEVICLKRS